MSERTIESLMSRGWRVSDRHPNVLVDAVAQSLGQVAGKVFFCNDCRRLDPVPYMVHDAVWAEAGLPKWNMFVCPACLEQKLGRPLRLEDFTNCELNDAIFLGAKLALEAAIPQEHP